MLMRSSCHYESDESACTAHSLDDSPRLVHGPAIRQGSEAAGSGGNAGDSGELAVI